MPRKNIVVRKKKWNANDMAAAINHWINNVEQMESTLGRLLENMGCQRALTIIVRKGKTYAILLKILIFIKTFLPFSFI